MTCNAETTPTVLARTQDEFPFFPQNVSEKVKAGNSGNVSLSVVQIWLASPAVLLLVLDW